MLLVQESVFIYIYFFFISKKIILKRTSWKHKANQRTERDTNKEKAKEKTKTPTEQTKTNYKEEN